MIFDYLSENHELICDYYRTMFEFTSWMFVYVYMLLDLNWCGCFWKLNEKWEKLWVLVNYELGDDFGEN